MFGAGECKDDNGPSIPVVYDTGDEKSTTNLYGPTVRGLYLQTVGKKSLHTHNISL